MASITVPASSSASGLLRPKPGCSSSRTNVVCKFPSALCSPSFMSLTISRRPRRSASAPVHVFSSRVSTAQVTAESTAYIEFVRGTKELTVPEVRLTRSRDGSSGTATFIFDQPSVFEQSAELGDITGLYMIDEEGVMQSVEVSARFVNGRPSAIEARYIMRSEREWDRFMRFMERYAEENGLGFTKK